MHFYNAIHKVYFIFFIVFLGGGIPERGIAQSMEEISKQAWIDVNPSYFVNPGLELFGDAGVRRELENNGWIRMVVRPSVRYRFGQRLNFTAGLGNFFTLNKVIENRWEFRPFQGVSFDWPRWRAPLQHYIRLEERFDFNTETWNSENSIRGRYQLSVIYRWQAIRLDRYWQASISGEAFYTFAGEQGQFQEQGRATLGLERSLKYHLHFRIEITWQQEQLFFNPNETVSDIYFRFRYTYAWGNI